MAQIHCFKPFTAILTAFKEKYLMICENKKNNKYCEGKVRKKEIRIYNRLHVCERCWYKLTTEAKTKHEALKEKNKK